MPSSVRRAGDTDDFVQVALLRTLRRLPHLAATGNGSLQPYLRRVLVNLVRDHARSVGRGPAFVPLLDDEHADAAAPVDTLITSELLARYRAAVATLSRRERTALRARLERGLAYQDVARCAGCVSAAAARVMVGRALARVEDRMRARAEVRRVSPEASDPRSAAARA